MILGQLLFIFCDGKYMGEMLPIMHAQVLPACDLLSSLSPIPPVGFI